MSNHQTPVEAPRRKFLKGAAMAGVATLGFPMVAKAQGPISMRFQSTWPQKDIFHEYALDFAKKVNDMTGGDLKIEVLPAGAVVPAFGLIDAVSKGTLDGGHGVLVYHYGKQTALALWGSGPAFGMDANMLLSWHHYGGGRQLLTKLYQSIGANVVSFPYGPMATQPLGWFKKPVTKADDFKGLKFRTVGISIDVFQGLGGHRSVGKRHHVGVDRLVELVEQLLAPAVVVPRQQHVGVHAVGRARAPQGQRGLLAVVVHQHAVAPVERALRDRLEQAEGGHHRTGGQHLDLHVAARHVVHLLGEVDRVLVEDVLGRPGGLPAHGHWPLGFGDHGEAERRHARRGRALEEAATRSFDWCRLVDHRSSPLTFDVAVRNRLGIAGQPDRAGSGRWQMVARPSAFRN